MSAQDQPIMSLERTLSDVPRSLPPELLSFARERDLRAEYQEPPNEDEPAGGNPEEEGQPEGGGQSESFTDFDPNQVPEFESVDEAREWIGQRYGQMNSDYTQKTQGLAEQRREAEEAQALMEGLRNPESMPHYLRLLGYDFNDPETLQALGLEPVDGEGEGDPDEEPDPREEVNQLKEQIASERQEKEQQAEVEALDEYADEALESIEKEWGRELDEDEDAILRFQAESNPGSDGLPDYESAAKRMKGMLSRRVEEELKRRSEPGRGQPGGKPGGKAPDLSKDEDRLGAAKAAAERAMASQT